MGSSKETKSQRSQGQSLLIDLDLTLTPLKMYSTYTIRSQSYLLIQVWSLTGVNPSVKVIEKLGQSLGLRVTVCDLCLDLDLCVSQPSCDLLHEQQVNHVMFEPVKVKVKMWIKFKVILCGTGGLQNYCNFFPVCISMVLISGGQRSTGQFSRGTK